MGFMDPVEATGRKDLPATLRSQRLRRLRDVFDLLGLLCLEARPHQAEDQSGTEQDSRHGIVSVEPVDFRSQASVTAAVTHRKNQDAENGIAQT